MSCIKIKTSKYQTRKGPPYHAKDCKGLVKKGNDKKDYISKPDKKGIYKWVLKNSGLNITHKKMAAEKSYIINDHFRGVFKVFVYPEYIEIFTLKENPEYSKNTDNEDNMYQIDKKVLKTNYTNIFIGDNYLEDKFYGKKGLYAGNSIIIQTGIGKYIYVGPEIYSFETQNDDEIVKYYSPVGSLFIPYHIYAVGKKYTYFMEDRQSIPNELLDLKKDAYGQFYGYTIKDNALKRKINSSKKKFKTKQIHKRTF